MKRHLSFFLSMLVAAAITQAQTVSRSSNGVKILSNKVQTMANDKEPEPQTSRLCTEVVFYSPSAVRIIKYPASKGAMPNKKSYSIIARPTATKLLFGEDDEQVTLKSECMEVCVGKHTGSVRFSDLSGKGLLTERTAEMELITKGADKDMYKIRQSFILDEEEAIFGLGQRQCSSLNQRGQKVRIWCGNTNITIPYFSSEKGYGLYWDNAGDSYFEDTSEKTSFSSEVAPCIDYYFMFSDGSQDGVIAAIRSLTGQATMFPLWTMGHWQCRERYKSSDELCDVLDKYRELQIPLDGIVQDWQYWGCDSNWNAMQFMNPHYINKMGDEKWMRYLPNDEDRSARYPEPRIKSPQEMVEYVHSRNAHLMISIWASFGPWTPQAKELGKINALMPFDTWPRNRGVLPYDPFNPKARDIYWKYLRNLYDMGMDAWWTDSTEPDHFEKPGDSDYMTHDGSWRSVKNAFALMTNRGIYEHQRKMKGNSKRSVQMTRCGTFGIQHYGTFSWSGDVVSDWDVMKNQIPSGLNYVICGIPFWNTDIGGFFGWNYNNDPLNPAMQELQVRWMQWGCFMPLMRNHCSSPMVNELYRFGNPGDWAFDVQKKFIELRYRLLPYIYSTAGDVVLNSGSMMRPLVMDFASDKKAILLNDEYMFGRSLLVKPVTDPLYTYRDEWKHGHTIYPDITQAAAPVKVYLPAGADWYDFWTNEKKQGGKEVMRLAPIDIMPVYVKAGTILPMGPIVQYAEEKPWDDLEIRIYPGCDADFTLYEDEGDGYNYEKGMFTLIEFHWDDKNRTLTVSDRKGSYKGMLAERSFKFIAMDKDTTGAVTADYSGSSLDVNL